MAEEEAEEEEQSFSDGPLALGDDVKKGERKPVVVWLFGLSSFGGRIETRERRRNESRRGRHAHRRRGRSHTRRRD